MAKETIHFTESELSRIVEMAWEDRTPFEALEQSFSLNESAVDAVAGQAAFVSVMAAAGHQSKDEALNAAIAGCVPRLLRNAVQAAVVLPKN